VEARHVAPQVNRLCPLPDRPFELFIKLLRALGTPLVEMAQSLGIKANGPVKINMTFQGEPTFSFRGFDAEWRDTVLKTCSLHLYANENEQGHPDPRDCFVTVRRKKIEYSLDADRMKKLDDSNRGEVWSIIARAMEDLASPGRQLPIHLHINNIVDTEASLSFESGFANQDLVP
jgi:hypothetical protein